MSKLLGKHMLGNGKCSVRRMTFKQLDKCCRNKTVQVPEAIQTELEHDKVKAIIKAYKKHDNSNYFLHHGYAVSLCHLKDMEYYYVVDGQHRLAAIRHLYSELGKKDKVMIRVLDCETVTEMQEDFELNNIKSKISDMYRAMQYPKFNQSMMFMKDWLKRNFIKAFNRNRNPKRSRRMHIETFLEKFDRHDCLSKFGEKISDKNCLKNWINMLNEEVHAQLTLCDITDYVTKIDIKGIHAHKEKDEIPFYLSLTNVKWNLSNERIHIERIKYKHSKIPKSVRNSVLERDFQNNHIVPCPICTRKMCRSESNVHIGHIIAAKHGGGINMHNLKAICQECNLSMGTMNMHEFQKFYSTT